MATIISNQASATYTYEGSSDIFTTSSNIASTTLLDDFSLEVQKITYQDSFKPSENITYSILIKNTGVKEVKDLTITISHDNLIKYKPDSAKLLYKGSVVSISPSQTDALEFIVPNILQVGDWLTITYIMVVNDTIPDNVMELSDSISVTSSSIPSSRMSTFSTDNSTTLTRFKSASLVMSKQVSKSSIQSSDTYDYVITIENVGLMGANNVIITDALPKGFKVESITLNSLANSHTYSDNEYDINSENVLTLPNANGFPINVSASNSTNPDKTTILISGTYSSPITNIITE